VKKITLYSRSGVSRKAADTRVSAPDAAEGAKTVLGATSPPSGLPPRRARWRTFAARHERPLLAAGAVLLALTAVFGYRLINPPPLPLTQQDIDAAVLHTLEHASLPSRAAKAYETVRRSVVRVHGIGRDKEKEGHAIEGIGTGVVIVDTGIILTNMHVVVGAERIDVEFDDGLESEATIIGVRPEHDLAVLKAKKLPDDLPAATMRSTADLAPGDEVVAVGFPFGIGPSASAGVVSGLRREYRSRAGDRVLTNLIQFDAAVNPGNSGGPLVTMDGEVVGIVTAILNPTDQKVFIGIGFAVPIENAAAAIGMSPF
jgi:S1-C subfamily serine protease